MIEALFVGFEFNVRPENMKRKVGDIRYDEARSRGRSSPDSLAF